MSKISVVMATYNGAKYVERQIASILGQLSETDEVIVVDDDSSDSTLDVIEGMSDVRILIHRNISNLGVQKSFEKAIQLATGELIFLCDQDDIWRSDKVKLFTEVFATHPDVTLVISDARVVDKYGKVIIESFFERRGFFRAGVIHNLIKNKYLGCVMAFRKSLVERIIPFPFDIPQHDMWIGLVNAIYGEAVYIDVPLVDYRRHDGNASSASSNKRGRISQMMKWRWQLITNLLLMAIKRGVCKIH